MKTVSKNIVCTLFIMSLFFLTCTGKNVKLEDADSYELIRFLKPVIAPAYRYF
jgi:hypothetical protein